MTTKVRRSVRVSVPVATAYDQWTQFEDFPRFMGGVSSVTQLADDRLQWVAEIAGVRRQWEARIVEQVPDTKVAWAATEGATNAGTVLFQDIGGGQTSVTLELEFEPEGLVEKAGDLLGIVEKQAESDLERFKAFIESEGHATGAWRGTVAEGADAQPGADDAAASRGDSGRAGISGRAAATGAAAVAAGAAGVAAVAAATKRSRDDSGSERTATTGATVPPPTTPPAEPATHATTPAPPAAAGTGPGAATRSADGSSPSTDARDTTVESGPVRLVGIDDPATGTQLHEDADTDEQPPGGTRDDLA
jgi:uncharacterized protein YndB with AHSA1/START domain